MTLLVTLSQPSMANDDLCARRHIETNDALVGHSKGRVQRPRDSETAESVHDFRNILNTVSMLSELALMDLPEASTAGSTIRHIRAACADATDLCNRMLEDSRKFPKGGEWTDLSSVIRSLEPLLTTYLPGRSKLSLEFTDGLPVAKASPCEIRQVVMNLVKNAAEALGDRLGTVTVSTGVVEFGKPEMAAGSSWQTSAEGRYSYLVVADTGCGMDTATKARLLRQSFTTKSDGHGLGMASIRRIVQKCGGILQVQSRLGLGTQIRVLLPQDDRTVSTED